MDISNFANDTTPYACALNLKSVLQKLEHNSENECMWENLYQGNNIIFDKHPSNI